MTVLCPSCGSDAAVTSVAAPEGGLLYSCFYSHNGAGHVSWQVSGKKAVGLTTQGITAELVDPFEYILRELPSALIEYGVLEYRLRLDYPDIFASHVAAAGHYLTALGPGNSSASSVRFSMALQRLERAGVVTVQMRQATGAWSYNSKVGYYALTEPPPPLGAIVTWASYCTELGRSPSWDDKLDRAEVAAMAAKATPAM
jgi:hypothetical protein